MKKEWWCGYDKYETREDALHACDETDLGTAGMTWNGFDYYDRDTKESWRPVQECEVDEDGEINQCETIGYRKV